MEQAPKQIIEWIRYYSNKGSSGSTLPNDFLVNGKINVNYLSTMTNPNISLGAGDIPTNLQIGNNSFLANTTGVYNIVVGTNSFLANTTGFRNTVVGAESLKSNVTGRNNTAVGFNVLQTSLGMYNTGLGSGAGWGLQTGNYNTFIGGSSGWSLKNGSGNTTIGFGALDGDDTLCDSNNNIAIGANAFYNHKTGDNNIVIGTNTARNTDSIINCTIIGSSISSLPNGLSDTLILGVSQNMRIVSFNSGNTYIGNTSNLPTDNGRKLQIDGTASLKTSLTVIEDVGNADISIKSGSNGYYPKLALYAFGNTLAGEVFGYGPNLMITTSSMLCLYNVNLGQGINIMGDNVAIGTTNFTTFKLEVEGPVKFNGVVNLPNLPTSSIGLVAGDLWNDSGRLVIV